MNVIEKVLVWAQALQRTCFGTPVDIEISSYKRVKNSKTFSVGVSDGDNVNKYIFDSMMTPNELYQEWGRCKDYSNKRLDTLLGHKINKHGRLKKEFGDD